MDILSILKIACIRVRENIKDLLGTKEGAKPFHRGAGGDISRKIDLLAEEIVINTLKEYNLSCTLISEEIGELRLGNNENYVILDSIDGTTNAINGFPFSCCSIAYSTGYRLADVKYSAIINLFNNDLYYASMGNGAYLNDKRIKVREKPSYIIGANLSGATNDVIDTMKPVLNKSNHIRHLGANALELCLFAEGLMDAYIDIRDKLRITDMAGAYLIVKEAGGIIIDRYGSYLDSSLAISERLSFITAINRAVLEEIANDLNITLKI